ncbi:MAG: hypothetical protein AMJ81_10855, partial [Phycisphaerae bacterium SM23_33]
MQFGERKPGKAMATADSSRQGWRAPAGAPAGNAQDQQAGSPAPQPGQIIGRVLPHSLDAEACVLGSMVLEPSTIDIVVHI